MGFRVFSGLGFRVRPVLSGLGSMLNLGSKVEEEADFEQVGFRLGLSGFLHIQAEPSSTLRAFPTNPKLQTPQRIQAINQPSSF